jgi:hypothetical protein
MLALEVKFAILLDLHQMLMLLVSAATNVIKGIPMITQKNRGNCSIW